MSKLKLLCEFALWGSIVVVLMILRLPSLAGEIAGDFRKARTA
jgi:hypothetical protein